MKKDRIIKSAINKAIVSAKDSGDARIKKLNDSDIGDLIELIIDHHVHCLKDEMLSGETRVIIPKIGSFTKKNNKAIFNKIKNEVLQKHGYSNWSDVPKIERNAIIREINTIAKVKFKSIKDAKRIKAVDMANDVSRAINKKC